MKRGIERFWVRWAPWILAVLFVAAIFTLSTLKHDSFHTRAFDLAKFDQAIWNTLHGQFLFSTLESQSILGHHFSPLMALVSPLFLIWDDIRVLFLVQAIGLAVAGLLLHKIVRIKYPGLATWFLLAFFLNPALHDVALVEFRRVTLAVPFLALALYALYTRQRVWMVAGLVLALLAKENIGLVVFMVGVYLLLFERDWKWGIPIALIGLAWSVGVTLWVVPALAEPTGNGQSLYGQLPVFCLEGDTYGEILVNVLRDPLALLGRMVNKDALSALWRIFFPLGLILPLLAFDWLFIALPSLAYMLMSCMPTMHGLRSWYMASVLPVLFAAVAVAITRQPQHRAKWATVALMCTAAIGYVLYNPAPPGGRYQAELYQVQDHHRIATEIVNAIPAGARVAAQDPYVPHLTHRETIYMFPWIGGGFKKIDYFVLDRSLHPYPLQPEELNDVLDEMISNTSLVIAREGDGSYLFHQKGEHLPSFPIGAVAGDGMLLERIEVALLGDDGFYQTLSQEPVKASPGDSMRVSLYWQALDAPNAERTVSVRVAGVEGRLVAQSDSQPAQGKKPTSEWQAGLEIRDVHFLTIPDQIQPGSYDLGVVVYDSYNGEIVSFEDDAETLYLSTVTIQKP